MGQFEKVVVLVVFFLLAVIGVVTFSTNDEGTSSMGDGSEVAGAEGDPRGAVIIDPSTESLLSRDDPGPGSNPRNHGSTGGDPAALDSVPEVKVAEGSAKLSLQDRDRQAEDAVGRERSAGDLFLDDSFDPSQAAARDAGGVKLPAGAALRSLEGLTAGFDEEIMEYVWRSGDTWVALAERFYTDRAMVSLLHQFNEGTSYVPAGDKILVPVFDRRGGASPVRTEPEAKKELSQDRGNLDKVEEGDSLWVISKKVYGRGALWEKIFDENKDRLSSPDDVRAGMELRIP